MTMCRFLLLIPLLLLVSEAAALNERSSPTLQGDSWPDVKERGSGTLIAVYVPAEGFAWHSGIDSHSRDNAPAHKEKLTGVTVDLLREFTRYLSETYDIELDLSFERQKHWPTFYKDMVDAGDGVIGMGNVTITEERCRELVFSPPYMTNIASLITHADATPLEALNELGTVFAGRTALAFEGTLHEERLHTLTGRYYPGASFQMAGSNDEIIELVSSEDRYFAYIDLYNYWRAADRGLPLQRHEAADEAAERFAYIMPLHTTWETVITEYFEYDAGLTHSDRYRQVMEKHLGVRLARILLDAASGSGR